MARRSPDSMETCLNRLLALPHLDSVTVQSELTLLSKRLEATKHDSTISIDAFLAAGVVEGGLGMVSNLLDLGVPQAEARDHVNQLLSRAKRIEAAHPGLDAAIEAGRVAA